MSTTGKVLTVLVTLVAIVWIILFSGITEFNKTGTKAFEAAQAQYKAVEDDLTKELHQAVELRDAASRQQEATGEALAVIRARQATLERERAAAVETRERYRFLRDKSEASVKGAKLDSETRLAELEAEKKNLAESQDEVKELQSKNKELMARLAELRDKFRETLRSNRERISRSSSR